MAVKKYRKKRQMTEEQRQAAIERLAKAREKRLRENPPQYKNIHPSVLALTEDDDLNMVNVKKWIKTQRELASKYKREDRQGVKGALAKSIQCENYARNMQNYLENGTWLDMHYGEFQQNKIGYVCKHMAYDANGEPKRQHGVFYPDINKVWGVDTDTDL
ncbi:MAG: hypothetical protein VXB01_16025 [Opitutae bacterium]|jgi:hypothetical protein